MKSKLKTSCLHSQHFTNGAISSAPENWYFSWKLRLNCTNWYTLCELQFHICKVMAAILASLAFQTYSVDLNRKQKSTSYGTGLCKGEILVVASSLNWEILWAWSNVAFSFTHVPAACPGFPQRQCGSEVYLMSHVICSQSGARGVWLLVEMSPSVMNEEGPSIDLFIFFCEQILQPLAGWTTAALGTFNIPPPSNPHPHTLSKRHHDR